MFRGLLRGTVKDDPASQAVRLRLIREPAPPERIALCWIDLDADPTPQPEARRVLEAGELARAARLRDPRDRRRFLLRRLYVRRVLAAWIGGEPSDVRFAYGAAGKPRLIGGGPGFSVSHSDGQALIAVAEHGAVGCDIERIDPGLDWRALLHADVLTPDEADRLAAREPSDATALLFEIWTLKEAALKAVGHGLSVPPAAVSTNDGGAGAGGETLRASVLRPPPGYAAALAWDTG